MKRIAIFFQILIVISVLGQGVVKAQTSLISQCDTAFKADSAGYVSESTCGDLCSSSNLTVNDIGKCRTGGMATTYCSEYTQEWFDYLSDTGDSDPISNSEMIFCQVDESISYCCPRGVFVDESDDGGGDVIIDDVVVSCPNNSGLESSLSDGISTNGLSSTLSSLNCSDITDIDRFNAQDECKNEYCQVGTSHYTCGCSPSYEAEDLVVNPSNTFVECTEQELSAEEQDACMNCMGSQANPTGAIWTELGCIDPSPAGLITRIFQIGLGVMGGIALLRTIQIAIAYQSDDPEQVKSAQEMLTSLVAGLILLAGGVVILQFVGVNILGIPREYLGG